MEEEENFKWSNTFVLTRHRVHDDWVKIMESLRDSNDVIDAFNPFHANKVLISVREKVQARLLCLNKRWVTIGPFIVKFKKWSSQLHAHSKLVPSYGGWLKFRGILLNA